MSTSKSIIKNVLLVLTYTTTYYVCASCGSNFQHSSAPPKLEDVVNPTDVEEPLNRLLFSDMYKSGTAVTAKQFLDNEKNMLQSGELSVNSQISPSFYVRNAGGSVKGLRVTVRGSAIEQGMLTKPEFVVGSQTYQPLLAALDKNMDAYKDAVDRANFVGAPDANQFKAEKAWTIDAPKIELGSGQQMHFAMNCTVTKGGSGDLVFSVFSLSNPGQALIRHTENIKVREQPNFHIDASTESTVKP